MNELKQLRTALGNFATGVCVVTTRLENDEFVGMTINSFSSVSLEPSLVLWSLKRDAATYKMFSNTSSFVINVLSESQADISGKYAKFGDHVLDKEDYHLSPSGNPLILDTLAHFECKPWSVLEAGDHDIILGSVTAYSIGSEAKPLLFYRGSYRVLEEGS